MSRFVKVASVPLNIPSVKDKPEGMSISDFMQAAIEHDVAQVLPDKPDLIVLPEMVDTPSDLTLNYHYSIVTTLNLDYKICHLDGNREKFAAAKRKYGSEVTIHDNGYIGTIILRSESPDRTAEDIVKEFDIEIRDDYYARSRVHRERCLAEH